MIIVDFAILFREKVSIFAASFRCCDFLRQWNFKLFSQYQALMFLVWSPQKTFAWCSWFDWKSNQRERIFCGDQTKNIKAHVHQVQPNRH